MKNLIKMSNFKKEFIDLKISIDELKTKVDSIWRQIDDKNSSLKRSRSLTKQQFSSQIDFLRSNQEREMSNKVENWLLNTDRKRKKNKLAFSQKKSKSYINQSDHDLNPIVMHQPSKQQEYEEILKLDIEEFSLCEFITTDSSEHESLIENETSLKSLPVQILGKNYSFYLSLESTKQNI
jgi:hypothetical protein